MSLNTSCVGENEGRNEWSRALSHKNEAEKLNMKGILCRTIAARVDCRCPKFDRRKGVGTRGVE